MVDESWFFAGLTTSFTDLNPPDSSTTANTTPNHKVKLLASPPLQCTLTTSTTSTDTTNDTNTTRTQPIKIFQMPPHPSSLPPFELSPDSALSSVGLSEQVMVFQHRTKFHAVDHQCPHRSYPLSKGTVYDIEDFGVVFSAGITCPKHGWAFDLHTGEADRGAYRLRVWEVEVRDGGEGEREVWVKKAARRRVG